MGIPLLTLLFLVVATQARELNYENGIKFNVVASRSIEEPPSIEVAFDNGIKDNFDLAHYQLDSKTPIGCRYIGRLQNDPSSTVAVSGCLNKPGDQMEVTMISRHNNHMMYTVDFDGNAEIQENPLGEKGQSVAMIKDRDDSWHLEGDEMINDALENEVDAAGSNPAGIPAKLIATIQFGYEDSFKRALDQLGYEWDSWIADVMVHTQALFNHKESLGTQIEFEVYGPVVHKQGVTWTADDNLVDAASETRKLQAAGNRATTFSWFCNRGGGWTMGMAYVGGLCPSQQSYKLGSTYNTNLCERQVGGARSGFLLAHELGHNFGMRHDFDHVHGGDDGPCNGNIMSYGSMKYNTWSTCSRSDFERHYNVYSWGVGCLVNPDAPKDEDYAPCGTITSDAIIASPNFPELYPTEASCTWIVQFDEGEQVQLEFTDFNVEWSYKCKYDYVAVRDGPDENSPLVGGQPWTGGDWCDESCNGDKYCGYNKPPVVISTGNALHIQFGSDLSGGSQGFRAVITKVGGPTTAAPTTVAPTTAAPTTPPPTTPAPGSCFEENAQYKGQPVEKPGKKHVLKNIESALECQQKCQEKPGCEYFTWNSGTGQGKWNKKNKNTCWLKKTKGGVRKGKKDGGKVSGPKQC